MLSPMQRQLGSAEARSCAHAPVVTRPAPARTLAGALPAAAAPSVHAEQQQRACRRQVVPKALPSTARPTSSSAAFAAPGSGLDEKRPLHVLIAGAGIGGLVLAVGLIKKGCKVTILERDLTAIRGEGKYRGPIQVSCWCCRTGPRHVRWCAAWLTSPPSFVGTVASHAQIQSNALGALEAIDPNVAEEVLAEGCITGDRINGLVDGLTGEW